MDSEQGPLYQEAWVRDHQAMRVGRSLVIGPPGTRQGAAPGDRVIELELFPNTPAAGVVFGTGDHATTRLVLALMEEVLRKGDRVLDVGTGSGILALAAARLGARAVTGIDIDPVAVRAAAANLRLNELDGVVRVREGGIEVVEGPGYDLALANVLSPVIREVAPVLRRLVRPGGLLIVSGIVAVEAEEVREALAGMGWGCREEREEGNWRAMVVQ